MKKIIASIFVFLFSICFVGFAAAGENATKEECMAKCKQAAQLVKEQGLDIALQKLNDRNGEFVWKDTYVFAMDIDEVTLIAHPIKPKLIGKKLAGMKDINGKMFFVEFTKVAKSPGAGWVSYMWPKLGEKKPSPKISYIYRVPGEQVAMGAGIYE